MIYKDISPYFIKCLVSNIVLSPYELDEQNGFLLLKLAGTKKLNAFILIV